MPSDDEMYPVWIRMALCHIGYWLWKAGWNADRRQALWRFMIGLEDGSEWWIRGLGK